MPQSNGKALFLTWHAGTAPGDKEPWASGHRSRKPPPAAWRVVFHEDTDRDHGGPHDPRAQRTSSTTDSRRRSKRSRTERAHIPTALTPAERERLAALHTGPHRVAEGASSSSATFLPGSAADPQLEGQHATDKQPWGPAADQRPAQGVGGQPPEHPPQRAERDDTGPGHGHRPQDQPGPCTTAFPTQAATQPNRQGAEGASQQREHGASSTGADSEMTDTSHPQDSDDPLPPTMTCLMPQQREPSMGYVSGGRAGTTPGHPSPTSATPNWDRQTMPPPTPPATAATEHGSFRRRGSEGALRHPRHHTLERASGSPPGTRPGRQPEQALRRGLPAARRINRNLCAASPGARYPRDTDLG